MNSAQCNIYDHLKEDFQEQKTIEEILDHLNISKNEYERALSISDKDNFQIYTKPPPNSCYVANMECKVTATGFEPTTT